MVEPQLCEVCLSEIPKFKLPLIASHPRAPFL